MGVPARRAQGAQLGLSHRFRERGSAPKRVRHSTIYFVPPKASVQWQPDGLTIHTKKWFLGAGFLGAPPISFITPNLPAKIPYRDSMAQKFKENPMDVRIPPLEIQILPGSNPLKSRSSARRLAVKVYSSKRCPSVGPPGLLSNKTKPSCRSHHNQSCTSKGI